MLDEVGLANDDGEVKETTNRVRFFAATGGPGPAWPD